MRKKLFVSSIGLFVVGSMAVWYFWNDISNSAGVEIDNPTEQQIVEGKQVIEESFNNEEADEELISGEVTDDKIQSTLHLMSHQKVEAKQKWGSLEITKERLEDLSALIDDNEGALAYYDTYRDILNRWLAGDFSRVDRDHNRIWELQDGTIGRATGLLNEAEEAAFIKQNFR